MGVRITDTVTPEGRRFGRMLRELADREVVIGFQHGDATEDDGTDICDIAAWNELGTEDIPSRPFLRKSVDENGDRINELIDHESGRLMNGGSAEQTLKNTGLFQKALIQEKITEGDFAPNAGSTVRKKGSSRPLVDTGRMRQSVNYQIRQKGSGEG